METRGTSTLGRFKRSVVRCLLEGTSQSEVVVLQLNRQCFGTNDTPLPPPTLPPCPSEDVLAQ